MSFSGFLDLYVRYYRLFFPAVIVLTAALWVSVGADLALSVMGAIIGVDLVLLGFVIYRAMRKGGK